MLTRTIIIPVIVIICLIHVPINHLPEFAFGDSRQSVSITKDSIDVQSTGRMTYLNTSIARELCMVGKHRLCIDTCNITLSRIATQEAIIKYVPYLYNYKGLSHKKLGNFFKAQLSFILGIQFAILLQNEVMESFLLSNLASLYLDIKEYELSLSISTELIHNMKTRLTQDQLAMILNNYAVASANSQKADIAQNAFDEILQYQSKYYPGGDYDSIIMFRNYGEFLMKNNRYDEGISQLRKAVAASRVGENNALQLLSKSYTELAIGYQTMGRIDSCKILFDQAVDMMLTDKSVPYTPQIIYETVLLEILISRGSFSMTQNEYKNSLSDFRTAISRLQRLSFINISESTRFIIAKKGQEAFDKGILCALKIFDNTKSQKLIDQAFKWSIQGKSLSLHWLSQRDHVYPIAGIPLDSLHELEVMKEEIQNWLEVIDVNELDSPDTVALNQICQTVLKYELLEQQIQDNYETISVLAEKNDITAKLVPNNFRHETYLGYQDLDSLLIVFGVNRNQRFNKIIKLDPTIRDDIDHYKELISSPRLGVFGQGEVLDFQDISNRIYSAIFEPVEEYIESKNLAIHLDGCLLGLPFESLVYNRTEPNQIRKFSDFDYLIQKYHFRYVASPFLLQEEGKPNSRKKSLLLTCPDQMNELSIASESNRINAILPNLDILSLDDIGSNFKTEMSNYQNIHISSHLLSRDDDFMESGLVCGNGEGSTILPFKEILYSKLNNAHIYLNGCESGSGPINHGEGLMSLSLAYAMAGAGSIIQHLWKAPDQAAADIAVQYYKNSKWIKSEKALQKAKMNYLKEAKPGHDHPFYWAGIVYYGYRHDHNKTPYHLLGAVIVLIFGMVYLRRRKARLK